MREYLFYVHENLGRLLPAMVRDLKGDVRRPQGGSAPPFLSVPPARRVFSLCARRRPVTLSGEAKALPSRAVERAPENVKCKMQD